MSVSYSPSHIDPNDYIKFVESVAYRTPLNPTSVFDRDDALGAGLEALWRAIGRYDAAKGASLRTYAWRNVMWGIKGEYRKQFPYAHDSYDADRDTYITFLSIDRPTDGAVTEYRLGGDSQEDFALTDMIPDKDTGDCDIAIDIRQAIRQLSPRQLEAIQGIYWEGLTHAEMGKRMGCGTATCSNYVQRALRKLRIIMEGGKPHPYVQHGRRRKIKS